MSDKGSSDNIVMTTKIKEAIMAKKTQVKTIKIRTAAIKPGTRIVISGGLVTGSRRIRASAATRNISRQRRNAT